MKTIRFALLLALAALLTLGAVGCKKQSASVEGSLEEIMQRIYDGTNVAEWPQLGNIPLDQENAAYYLGTEVAFTEGLASEALISAIPHSVCLIRVPEGTDVAGVKTAIRENVDPNKWICVGVSENDVVVDNIGSLVILIMSDESEALHDSFLALAGK